MTHLEETLRTALASRITRVPAGRASAWGALGALAAALSALFRWLSTRRCSAGEPRRLGPYAIERKLGEGGMGVVYKASHVSHGSTVAVKVLAPGRGGEHELARFEREVLLTSRLSHPNAISLHDFGRTRDGTFYYAMDYVDGVDLQTLVEREGPQSPARVASLLAQLASALSHAHRLGLVHRDVKPANVMVCEEAGQPDRVTLLDFGLSKQVDAGSELTRTDPQRLLGTPLYLSPESLINPEALDGRADLYAVGAVGYFLLTGLPPFTGRTAIEVCGHHLHTEPVPPSRRVARAIPRELEVLVLSCLAKDPEARPRSAEALHRALRTCAARGEVRGCPRWAPAAA